VVGQPVLVSGDHQRGRAGGGGTGSESRGALFDHRGVGIDVTGAGQAPDAPLSKAHALTHAQTRGPKTPTSAAVCCLGAKIPVLCALFTRFAPIFAPSGLSPRDCLPSESYLPHLFDDLGCVAAFDCWSGTLPGAAVL